ncbi:hypothetical protein ACWGI9_41705 [Streptomyces sp. NPDC054833]
MLAAIVAGPREGRPVLLLGARYAAAGKALRRAGIHELPGLDEMLALTRRAAEAACEGG